MKKGLALFATFLAATFLIGANSWAAEMMTAPKPATVKPVPIVKPAVTPQPATTSADTQQKPLMLMPSPQPPKEIQVLEAEAKKVTQMPRKGPLTLAQMEAKIQAIPGELAKLNIAKASLKDRIAIQTKVDMTLSSDNKFDIPPSSSGIPSGAVASFYRMDKFVGNWDDQALVSSVGECALVFTNPVEGWYIIDFYAGGKNSAKLGHSGSQPYIVATWDFSTSSSDYNDYVTIQYLAAGRHYFGFFPDGGGYYSKVSSIRINSYP